MPPRRTRESLITDWLPAMMAALSEGTSRAIAGDPGTPQPAVGASYAAQFSEQEHWLDFSEPAFALQFKVTALGLFTPSAKARLAGRTWVIEQLDPVENTSSSAARPGEILEHLADGLVVQTGDGPARILAKPRTEPAG